MKKLICLFISIFMILILPGCSLRSANNTNDVKLCNLDDCMVDDEVFKLSEDELQSVVAAKISIMELSLDAENLTNEDVAVFNYSTVTDFKKSIIEDIVSHRLIEEYYNFLIEKSVVKPDEEMEDFTEAILSNVKKIADSHNQSTDEFLKDMYQLDTNEFKSYLSEIWINMKIVFSYCCEHDIIYTETEIIDVEKLLNDSDEFQCYSVSDEIKTKLIQYFILDEKLQEYIAEIYKNKILYYSEQLTESLISTHN